MQLAFLETLRQLYSAKPPGPTRTFTELEMIRAIQILGEKKVLGRTLLSRLLKTGAGAIRTIINDLEKEEIITVEREGCRLTRKGLNIHRQITEAIPLVTLIDAGRLSVAKYDAAVLVKNVSSKLRRGIEQRDAAVRVGAKGATTLIYSAGCFLIPMGSQDCARDFPGGVWRRIESTFSPEDGDVVVVSSADNADTAIYGALAGALALLGRSRD